MEKFTLTVSAKKQAKYFVRQKQNFSTDSRQISVVQIERQRHIKTKQTNEHTQHITTKNTNTPKKNTKKN